MNVGSVRTVAVAGLFSGGLPIRPQIRRPVGAHDVEALAAIPCGHDHHRCPLTAALAAQAQIVEAPWMQVMPAGVARIDPPLAAARTGRQQAKTACREAMVPTPRSPRSDRSRRSMNAVPCKDRRTRSAESRDRAACRTSRAAIGAFGRLHHGQSPHRDGRSPYPTATRTPLRAFRQLSRMSRSGAGSCPMSIGLGMDFDATAGPRSALQF